jgi:hypothetical protein
MVVTSSSLTEGVFISATKTLPLNLFSAFEIIVLTSIAACANILVLDSKNKENTMLKNLLPFRHRAR